MVFLIVLQLLLEIGGYTLLLFKSSLCAPSFRLSFFVRISKVRYHEIHVAIGFIIPRNVSSKNRLGVEFPE
jgi:hypothetical protein